MKKRVVAEFDICISILLAAAAAILIFAHSYLMLIRALLIGASILVIVRWIAWSFTSEHSLWVRAFICGFVTLFVLFAIPPLLSWNG